MKTKSSGTLTPNRFLLFIVPVLTLALYDTCITESLQLFDSITDVYNSYNPYSHLFQCAVRAVLQVPAWPEKRGSLFAVSTVSLVLRASSAMTQVGIILKLYVK